VVAVIRVLEGLLAVCLYAVVAGTRPEIVKMVPGDQAFGGGSYILIHTGQHYSYELDRVFFEELGFPSPITGSI